MINAFYEPFPNSIKSGGTEYRIVTDFREWLKFFDMMNDKDLSNEEKIQILTEYLLDNPKKIDDELIFAVCDFYRAKDLEPEPPERDEDELSEPPPSVPVLDWKIDAPYIIGDFLRFYGIDLLTAKMHWWRFKILFSALPDNSQIMKRIGYRSIDLGQIKSDSERKRMMKLTQAYALPYTLSDEDIGAIFMG